MIVTPHKTDRIEANSVDLFTLIDVTLPNITDYSIVAVTSKVVSLCEGSVAPLNAQTKLDLTSQAASAILPAQHSRYGTTFTITNSTLIPNAGIDESNAKGVYVLWPRDAMKTAEEIRQHLINREGISHIGVVITDSTSRPMRRGTTGIALGFSGFEPTREYAGTPDLFGRTYENDTADIAGGLAAAAVLSMGEGAERTPLATLNEVPFVSFVDRAPTDAEKANFQLTIQTDLFEPFLNNPHWQQTS